MIGLIRGDLSNRIAFAILTPNAAQALADMKASLGSLGPARLVELEHESRRGGMITRRWKILCRDRRLQVVERGYPDGPLEEFLVTALND